MENHQRPGGTPLDIAVTAGGRALVAIDAGATLDATNGALLEYDLATGAHALRGDVGTGGRITSQARLLPSGDRRRVAVSWTRLPPAAPVACVARPSSVPDHPQPDKAPAHDPEARPANQEPGFFVST